MKIGIIGALKKEIQLIQNIIQKRREQNIGNYKIFIGYYKKNNIFLIKSGIGKVSSSIATTVLINLYKPDIIINVGSAGALDTSLKIGDVIVPKALCYYDVNLSNFGYSFGQIPYFPKKFLINKKLFNFINNLSKNFKFTFLTGLLVTGDTFIRERNMINNIQYHFSSAIAVDMEATAIAQTCYQFNIPAIIIKSISDSADQNATIKFKKNIFVVSLQLFNFVQLILKNIIKI
ncbi:MAG: 5'-methylthioadenosine/adenosylhomocysteine nucleosidase [Buchnera aphidicola (Pentalonia nigronervosa)]|jgi:adenosylhomocysteine nucleosidase|uniref:adenosylhomocysteine nucleosidase n=1 Tax=Buchnera aphidicola (Pentalonia nigronervosa) TaxID=1309793 RepID=A0A7H1AZM2_9GAMM|nr:MAG: 5'-methylthioadenosine/adenosylhomocysteine nucleosidase [Buchnera aphidicola (Pentalonia nigronervosa)]